MVNALPYYDQTLFLLSATIEVKVIIRSKVLVLKLNLVTLTETATKVEKLCNNPTQPTSLNFPLPLTPFHLNSYQLNRGINSQSYNGTPIESAWNSLKDYRQDHQRGPTRSERWLCYSHQWNNWEWQCTWLITLWLQLVNQNVMDTSRAYWQIRPPINCNHHQPQNQIPASHPKGGQVVLQWCRMVLFYQHDWITKAASSRRANFSICTSRFNNILISATSLYVGKTKASKKPKPWINSHVWAKILNRDRLLSTVYQNRQKCIDVSRKVNDAINKDQGQ